MRNLPKAAPIPVVCLFGLALAAGSACADVSRYSPRDADTPNSGAPAGGVPDTGARDANVVGGDPAGGTNRSAFEPGHHGNPLPVSRGNPNHGGHRDPRRGPDRPSNPPGSGSAPPENGNNPPADPPVIGNFPPISENGPIVDGHVGDSDGEGDDGDGDGSRAVTPEPGLHAVLGIGLLALVCLVLRRNAGRRMTEIHDSRQ